MDNFNLLIVDDDENLYGQYDLAVKMAQKNSNININLTKAKTCDDGLSKLKKNEFDGAIIDLRLSSSDSDKNNGNILIKNIKGKMKFPVFVLSGFTNDLDNELASDKNDFFKVYKRGEKETKDIIEELIIIYKLGITKIFKNQGLINSYLNNIFWKYISNNFSNLKLAIANNTEKQNSEKILLRFIVAHLQQYLNLDSKFSFEDYNTFEMYIIPPIMKKLFTGTILENTSEQKYFIVLSPPCDLASKNIKYITVAEIEPLDDIEQLKILKSKLIKAQKRKDTNLEENIKNQIKSLLNNNSTLKYHFLPPSFSFKGGFINFQKVNSLSRKELDNNYDLVASISDSFVKDIIARFSHYYSRQGQPNFSDINTVYKKIID